MSTFPADSWVLEQTSLAKMNSATYDRIFTIGNGLIGSAGIPPVSSAGTYGSLAAGIYCSGHGTDGGWTPPPGHSMRNNEKYPDEESLKNVPFCKSLVLPSLFNMALTFNNTDVCGSETVRCLDMRSGVLKVNQEADLQEGHLAIQSTRFASLALPGIAAEQIQVISSVPGSLKITFIVNDTIITDAPRAWKDISFSLQDNNALWCAAAQGSGDEVAFAVDVECSEGAVDRSSQLELQLTLQKDAPVTVYRFTGIAVSTLSATVTDDAQASLEWAGNKGWDQLLKQHEASWNTFWDMHDILIEGNTDDQIAVRYSIFQLRCGILEGTDRVSVGPRFLSGAGHNQCVFWDTDVYINPYLIMTAPELARNHLMYRYNQLDLARKTAVDEGYAGARFPWQTIGTDSNGGSDLLILVKRQIHVTCDVAWGVMKYLEWTGDHEFMSKYGSAILAETARYWMSRLEQTPRGMELNSICGPDEMHSSCNNNAYTNLMVRNNLLAAVECADTTDEERSAWREAASAVYIPRQRDGVLEQFDGFFELREKTEDMPDAAEYQWIKQADVAAVPMVLPGLMTAEQTKAAYDYYLPRTAHGSNLSVPTYAWVAARIGQTEEAYRMFSECATMTLGGDHHTESSGVHGVNAAMIPRIVMEGFCGLSVNGDSVSACPNLPEEWSRVTFNFQHRGKSHTCDVTPEDNGTKIQF